MFRNVKELWDYRSLVWALVCRHLAARYRGSFLGFLWSFLNPLCLIAVYSLVFRFYMRFTGVEHYTMFLFAGLLPWIWFSSSLLEATGSISGGGSLITKAMFPPQILPTVSVLTNLMNFLFAIPLLLTFMFVTGIPLTWHVFLLPVVIFFECIFLLGLAIGFSAINVYYRDVQHVLGSLMTLWFFLCPIVYPAEQVPERLKFTLFLNPVAVFTQFYHAMFVEGEFPTLPFILLVIGLSGLSFMLGNAVFNRYRENFAELV